MGKGATLPQQLAAGPAYSRAGFSPRRWLHGRSFGGRVLDRILNHRALLHVWPPVGAHRVGGRVTFAAPEGRVPRGRHWDQTAETQRRGAEGGFPATCGRVGALRRPDAAAQRPTSQRLAVSAVNQEGFLRAGGGGRIWRCLWVATAEVERLALRAVATPKAVQWSRASGSSNLSFRPLCAGGVLAARELLPP